jgi:hypothetical protein
MTDFKFKKIMYSESAFLSFALSFSATKMDWRNATELYEISINKLIKIVT